MTIGREPAAGPSLPGGAPGTGRTPVAAPAATATGPPAASDRPPGWVRRPAVAGTFYPSDAAALRSAVHRYVERASLPGDLPRPKAVIAAHAGYRYSGPTAGLAYRALAPARGRVTRAVVIGPAHRVPVGGVGVGVSTAAAWHTPLGDVPLDVAAARELVAHGEAVEADAAHAPEHSIEVQVPFLQAVLGDVRLVPLVVGRARTEQVARALARVWGGDETAVVVSSDLSHYLDEATARARDERTAATILEQRVDDIGPYDACGCLPIRGAVVTAHRHGLVPRRLGLSTSADTSGDRSRVVGYGAFALVVPRPLDDAERCWLVGLARRAIAYELGSGETYPLADGDVPERLRPPGASFVTLEQGDRLLGCIGSLEPRRPLWHDVARNARAAAFDDPRFDPLGSDALPRLQIEISVLSALEELAVQDRYELERRVRPGVDGVLLAAGRHRGTFLPAVWGKLPEPGAFVGQLVRKAGFPGDQWPPGTRAWRYTTDEFTDPPVSGPLPSL